MSFDANRDKLASILMEYEHTTAPLIDATNRLREELVKKGWSPQGAENMAATWYGTLFSSNGGAR
ncbi:hypothetical protein ACWCXC_15650 [Streptomyces sp. NPDC001515]